jgi:predicted transcriptional regulator
MYSAFARKVRDVMSRGVVTVRFDAPLKEAVRIMADADVTAIIAVDDRGEIMGVVSSIDVVKYLKDRTPEELDTAVVEDVMTPSVIQVEPNKTLKDAAEIMIGKRIHRLVVLHPHQVAGNRPVGVISTTDLIRELNKTID